MRVASHALAPQPPVAAAVGEGPIVRREPAPAEDYDGDGRAAPFATWKPITGSSKDMNGPSTPIIAGSRSFAPRAISAIPAIAAIRGNSGNFGNPGLPARPGQPAVPPTPPTPPTAPTWPTPPMPLQPLPVLPHAPKPPT